MLCGNKILSKIFTEACRTNILSPDVADDAGESDRNRRTACIIFGVKQTPFDGPGNPDKGRGA
jgi:hypothetical protein